MKALWNGFEITNNALKGPFSDWIEILPGDTFILLFQLLRLGSWIVNFLTIPFFASNTKPINTSDGMSSIPIWFTGYTAEFATPYYHWCGSCPMPKVPTDPNGDTTITNDSVVNENLHVLGMPGLRVCDASVFPDCVRVPTALTCAALGYAASEIVWKQTHGFDLCCFGICCFGDCLEAELVGVGMLEYR